ncbi:hypothetical protein G8759_30290 [Spirosoma aureum]|uniref:Transposase n=1 Tax=Spirosoma aureum TaxID=2692134 RepID=A0A6G9AWA5_9BACT|nr:hypothetical protein [Spirosoma aureum]QIP16626.1 hypothetical protein G8759_30290 [Spirosoma aureum]
MQLTAISVNDLPALRQQVAPFRAVALVGDKAYGSRSLQEELATHQAVILHTPGKVASSKPCVDTGNKLD